MIHRNFEGLPDAIIFKAKRGKYVSFKDGSLKDFIDDVISGNGDFNMIGGGEINLVDGREHASDL